MSDTYPEPITLKFNVQREDMRAIMVECNFSSPTYRSMRRRVRLMSPLMLAVIWCVFLFLFGFNLAVTAVFAVAAVMWFFIYPARFDRNVEKYSKKMLDEERFQKSFGAYNLTLGSSGLHSISPMGEGSYPWGSVERVLLTNTHLLIILYGGNGYPIPISDVGIEAAQAAREYAMTHITAAGTGQQQ